MRKYQSPCAFFSLNFHLFLNTKKINKDFFLVGIHANLKTNVFKKGYTFYPESNVVFHKVFFKTIQVQ